VAACRFGRKPRGALHGVGTRPIDVPATHALACRHGSAGGQYTQLVLLPTLRMQLARGASPWFFDVGVGVSWTDHAFQTPGHTFSTRWNFQEVLGAGYVLGGPKGRDEIQLRLGHFSNAGLENPNPGETYLQLRYARRF
jgi:lipid A 3-O-deacylase